jgi:hypothetical protein
MYQNILDLNPGETVMAKMPILSMELHRKVYVTVNQQFRKPFRVIILPYLHERKIYLNKMKPGNKYYYTSI